jgi:hypothetical protein
MTMNQDRCALVTGASSGIGEAIARRLASDGLRVFGASRKGIDSVVGVESLVLDVAKFALRYDYVENHRQREAGASTRKTLAEKYDVPVTTIGKWIRIARQHGLLTPVTRGQRGGMATALAREFQCLAVHPAFRLRLNGPCDPSELLGKRDHSLLQRVGCTRA